jgi:hypothetical protein
VIGDWCDSRVILRLELRGEIMKSAEIMKSE